MNYLFKLYNFFSIFLLVFAWPGCNAPTRPGNEATRFTDDLGRPVRLAQPPKRVMGLAPSMTELLFFVCDPDQVAAVTKNCNYPALVKTKPAVSTYPMDFEGLLQVKPDLVFTMEGITSAADAQRLESLGIPVYFQRIEKVEDVFRALEAIGKITGHAQKTRRLTDSLRTLKAQVEARTRSLPKPRVLAITYPDPIYVYGKNTLFTDKLTAAGGQNAVDSVFEAPYPALTREYILKINPDIIIGGSFEKMDSSFFRRYPELKRTNAYRNRRIYDVDDDLNSRPSPRVVESILELKRIVHPEIPT